MACPFDTRLSYKENEKLDIKYQGPVPQKPINANLRLKINQAVYFSTPKCCSTQIFGRTLHEKTSILKNKNKQKKLSPKSENVKQKFTLSPDQVNRLSRNRAQDTKERDQNKSLWHCKKIKVVPVIMAALGTIPKGLIRQLNIQGMANDLDLLQKACILGSARILRRVLEGVGREMNWKFCFRLLFSRLRETIRPRNNHNKFDQSL